MKYIIYKTTNIINGKIYIGVHGTYNINDSYLGSGRLFLKAIKKYGKHNFKKEILFIYDNKMEALNKELELVNEEFIKKEDNYNCTIGGYGGIGKSQKGYKHTKEAIEKIKEASKRPCKEETKIKISLANKNRKMKPEFVLQNSLLRKKYYETNKSSRLGIKCSEETKKKMSESTKKYYETNKSHRLGIKVSDETRKKMIESPNRRKVINKKNGEIYKSAAAAIRLLNIPARTLYRNIKKEKYFLKYE